MMKRLTVLRSLFRLKRSEQKPQVRFPYAGREHFHLLLQQSHNDIVFAGDSHISLFPLEELFQNLNVKNRGHGGSNSYDLLYRIKHIAEGMPAMVFISIGVNDISQGIDQEITLFNLREIISIINHISPNTKIHLISLLPVWKNRGNMMSEKIVEYNKIYEELCKESGVFYINAHDALKDKDGFVVLNYTSDGVHLNGYGYFILRDVILPYIEDHKK